MPRSPARVAVALAALGLVVSGCSGGPAPEGSDPTPESESEPVVDTDFPDPDILATDEGYVAFATNGNSFNVQMATSSDLESWTVLDHDALPELPNFVIPGKTWAPEVSRAPAGGFVMYFTATNFEPTLQCIGVATSKTPDGPFEAAGDEMLVCPEDEGGAIDASTFTDDNGTFYLLWKNDGNCCALDTWIWLAQLAPDGLSIEGKPRRLFKQTLEWEGELVEAPTMVKRAGEYVVFYSSNSYGDERYAIGVARAESIGGEWEKNETPFFSTDLSDGEYIGPGGQDVVTDAAGNDFLVFHSWDADVTYRAMFVEPLEWDGSEPSLVLD